MSISPIKYESKILSNLASMLKLSEKTDKEIWSEIKEEKEHIKFEIDEDIRKVIDVNKINCTCDESKKKIEEYKGKKFEYYYNVETYGVDFFLDICNALGRSNYKPFLSEQGKKEVMNGLRIRRNSNLYKYVSFFLSKERLNKDRLNDGKTPEHIFHCFKCLKSVLHIYVDDQNNRKRKMYLQDNKYITEEMEEKMENDLLSENQKNSNVNPPNFRDGIIAVSRYKAELASISRKSNERIIKTILGHSKDMHSGSQHVGKDSSINGDSHSSNRNSNSNHTHNRNSNHHQQLSRSNSFEDNKRYKTSGFFDKHELKHFSDSANSFSIDGDAKSTHKNAHSKKTTNLKINPVTNNLIQKNAPAGNLFLSKNRDRQGRTAQSSRKSRHSAGSSKKSGSVKKKDPGDMAVGVDAGVAVPGGSKPDVGGGHFEEPQTDAPALEVIAQGNEPPRKLSQSETVQHTEWDKKLSGEGERGGLTEKLAVYSPETNHIVYSPETNHTVYAAETKLTVYSPETKHATSPANTKLTVCSADTKLTICSAEGKMPTGEDEPNSKDAASDEADKESHQYDVYQKTSLVKNASNGEEDYDFNASDDASYSTDDSNYKRYMTKKKTKLQQEGKIVIDLNILNGNAINASEKKEKEKKIEEKYKERCQEKHQERIRMDGVRKSLEEKKMIFCKIEEVAKRRNKRHVKTQVLSEDSKIERAYFSHKMKKFYNSKSGYFGCGWSNNRTQWTPFIHAPFFDNHHNTIYKNRNKKMYEEIYDTLLHGRIHPSVRIVELKDHKHPVRLCTPYYEDCYSVVYTGKKILASDDRVIFGEYTGYVANNRELSQEKHQYTFALSFNKKVFNDRKSVVFINEIESDEEGALQGGSPRGGETNGRIANYDGGDHCEYAAKLSSEEAASNDEQNCQEGAPPSGGVNAKGGCTPNLATPPCEKSTHSYSKEKKKSKGMNNKIILPDNYTYAVDSSYMFNEMSLVNHYKTCAVFNNYDFRINAEWQLVYLDGWPHIILTSIPGVEINTGEEIFADFGFEWFEKVNDICLNEFIKNSYAYRLSKLNLCKEKNFTGIDDIVEKYNLIKNHLTCNICMYSVNTDSSHGFIACSGCNHIYHLACVQKLNAEVNENYDWFCASCVKFCINVLNQEEFLAYLEKENHKQLIDLFSDMCVENSNKLSQLLAPGASDTPLCGSDGKESKGVTGNPNCAKQYDKIRKLLQCRENIIDLVRNKEIINSYLESTEKEMNSLENAEEGEDLSFKKDEMKLLLQNSFELHLLVEYKKKIDDLLASREKVDTFVNDEKAKNTMQLRKKTINYLLENRKYIEKLVDSMEQGTPIVFPHKEGTILTKGTNNLAVAHKEEVHRSEEETTLKGLKEELPHEHTLAIQKYDPSFGRGGSPGSGSTEHTNGSFSNSYETILYNKSNDVVKNLKEIKKGAPFGGVISDAVNCPASSSSNTGGNKNLCFSNMMKLSKKILGFPLLTDFERGMSTNQPCLPLSDHLKRLSVCTVCYSKHNDLAKAIICRVTKMHFEANYNDGLGDEDMFKTSSECIQSVIRELANTIKEYRKRELSGAYVQELARSGSSSYRSCSSSSYSSRGGSCAGSRGDGLAGSHGEIHAVIAGPPLTDDHNDIGAEAHSPSSSLKLPPQKPFYGMMSDPPCSDRRPGDTNNPFENNTPPLLWDNKVNYTDDYTCKRGEVNSTLGKRPHEEDNKGSSQKKSKLRTKPSNDTIGGENGDSLKGGTDEGKTHEGGGNVGSCTAQGGADQLPRSDLCRDPRGDPCVDPLPEQHAHRSKDENQKGDKNDIHFAGEKLDEIEAPGDQKGNYVTLENISKASNFIPLLGVELGSTKIQREFTNGTYVGTVTEQIKDEHGNPFFVVTYEDGDAEWMTPCFLFQELLKQSTNSVDYPLATTFKEVFNPEFKKDLKLSNCSLELKIERRKRKSNCESASNNNSVSKRQKHAQEENSSRKKKQRF
ncbi:histone-lysine N-methyltransferase, H3 lysine-4 specific, putative [Plasmodium vivax]|uniref:Histone-lysine N-methyltransferase, H3 lysine-4 specific, putative n=1 Tax=Plasmodium vivax TaxID=5855 RepID=A0A1G4HKE7_PLAVI|nr:histone-lysine N-methyltransferase, H3 lysine-4 specific, putative [Plasmodium vivax]